MLCFRVLQSPGVRALHFLESVSFRRFSSIKLVLKLLTLCFMLAFKLSDSLLLRELDIFELLSLLFANALLFLRSQAKRFLVLFDLSCELLNSGLFAVLIL